MKLVNAIDMQMLKDTYLYNNMALQGGANEGAAGNMKNSLSIDTTKMDTKSNSISN